MPALSFCTLVMQVLILQTSAPTNAGKSDGMVRGCIEGALYFDGPWSTWFDGDHVDYYTLKLAEGDGDAASAEVLGTCISEAGNTAAMEQWLGMLDGEVEGVGNLQVMIRVTQPTAAEQPRMLEGELE